MEIKVVVGGRGRWIAREVIDRYANGRPRTMGRAWTGIAPRHADRQIVIASIEREMRRGEADQAAVSAAPKGGWTFDAVALDVAGAITITIRENPS